ncbi:MAG: metal ABC transporter substrate-binding protein [Spirochaetales bacterium]
MHRTRLGATLVLAATATVAFAAGTAEPTVPDAIPRVDRLVQPNERLSLVATTSIVGDVLANVAGDAADLTILMERGQNPHAYEPSPSALRSVEAAHLVFVNGFDLEEALLGSIADVASGPIVPVSAGIEPLDHDDHDDHDEAHDHHGRDPHVWMDPNNVVIWVDNMVRVLAQADPANADVYRENGEQYAGALREVDRSIREQVSRIPPSNRKLVVDHKTFSYFADEYDMDVVGAVVPGTSDRDEPSAQEVARLVEVIRTEDIAAILVGRTASRGMQRLAEAVAQEAGRPIEIVPTLTGSLATRGEPGDTYIGLLEYNVDQILSAIGE